MPLYSQSIFCSTVASPSIASAAQIVEAVPTPSAEAAPSLRRPASESCVIMKKFGPGVIAAIR